MKMFQICFSHLRLETEISMRNLANNISSLRPPDAPDDQHHESSASVQPSLQQRSLPRSVTSPPPLQPHLVTLVCKGGQMGGYDNTLGMYPGQTRTGFNNIIPFNQTRQYSSGGMPGKT